MGAGYTVNPVHWIMYKCKEKNNCNYTIDKDHAN